MVIFFLGKVNVLKMLVKLQFLYAAYLAEADAAVKNNSMVRQIIKVKQVDYLTPLRLHLPLHWDFVCVDFAGILQTRKENVCTISKLVTKI